MINLFLKKNGAATLVFATVLIILSTLIIIFAANVGRMQNKSIGNQNRNAQAYQAAQAGIEFAINYLQMNAATIIASPSSGFINFSDSSTTNINLANGSRFSVVYTNPTANNYNLIRITSTGTSDDSSSTRVVSQLVQLGSLLTNTGTTSLTAKGAVAMSGNATVANTTTGQTISSATTVSLSGSSKTVTSGGTSSVPGNIKSDVTQNSTSLANMSQSDYFASFFGTTSTSAVQGKVAHYYNNSSNTNYSSTLNGMTGTSIWIDQTSGTTASINGNTTIGTTANPVLIVVNGTLSLSGNVTINGFIYVIGSSGINTISGNININGGLATSDELNMSGNSTLTYNPTILNNLKNNSSMRYYARVPGSWKDF